MKFKDYIYILYIALLPFTLSLIILRLNRVGLFTNKLYYYIIILLSLLTIITFVWSLFYTLDDLLYREKNITLRNFIIAIMLFFSPLYIPIHYIVNYYKKYHFISYFLVILFIFSFYYSYYTFDKYNLKLEKEYDDRTIIIKDNFDYLFDNDQFKVHIDFNYICQQDKGDYRLFCDNNLDDSFIGIYSYDMDNYSDSELLKAYKFHIDQTKEYIIEAGYTFIEELNDDIIVLTYNDKMQVYIKYTEYDINNDNSNDISLIVIYELAKDDNNINRFNNLINSIKVNNSINERG